MKIKTQSGTITVSKRSRYGHWLQGRIAAGGWTGQQTLADAWQAVKDQVNAMHTYHDAYLAGIIQVKLDK